MKGKGDSVGEADVMKERAGPHTWVPHCRIHVSVLGVHSYHRGLLQGLFPPFASFGCPSPLCSDRLHSTSCWFSYRGQSERMGTTSSLLMTLSRLHQSQPVPPRTADRSSSSPSQVSAATGFVSGWNLRAF